MKHIYHHPQKLTDSDKKTHGRIYDPAKQLR